MVEIVSTLISKAKYLQSISSSNSSSPVVPSVSQTHFISEPGYNHDDNYPKVDSFVDSIHTTGLLFLPLGNRGFFLFLKPLLGVGYCC